MELRETDVSSLRFISNFKTVIQRARAMRPREGSLSVAPAFFFKVVIIRRSMKDSHRHG